MSGALHGAVDSRRVTVPGRGVPRATRLDVPDTPIPSRADVQLSVRSNGGHLLLNATVAQETRSELAERGQSIENWPPVMLDEQGVRELVRVQLQWLKARGAI